MYCDLVDLLYSLLTMELLIQSNYSKRTGRPYLIYFDKILA